MTNEQPAWPSEHIALDAASRWVASTCAREVDAPEILQIKRWGVTARFGSVVLKASFAPLFPQGTDVHALLERIVPVGAPSTSTPIVVGYNPSCRRSLWTLIRNARHTNLFDILRANCIQPEICFRGHSLYRASANSNRGTYSLFRRNSALC